jgi:hypothetical protein
MYMRMYPCISDECSDVAVVRRQTLKLKAKAKAVPLHAMKALRGRGSIGPTHS